MSGTYTSDEKVEYALKTALFRTMQSKDQPSSVEKSAPPRIFPKNIMKKNLIEKGEGDIDEDGYYVGGTGSAYGNNDLANLEEPELTITNYRIIDPTSNKITNKRVSDLTTVNMSQTSHNSINALPTTGTNYPLKSWFFRGHYGSHSGEAAFNAANSSYDGLQLAWDKSTVGNTATEADIVPHLKFYLQVQTEYTNVAHGDNISYGHDLMKGLIGLDQNFSTTIQVVQGQGGSCVTLGETGTSTGDFWFTQATAGIISFYGVTNKVNASDALNGLSTTKFPMISYIRYVGETGFGAGSGGGGAAADPEQAVTEEPSWGNTNLDTIFYGNVGIGTTSPLYKLEVKGGNGVGATYDSDHNYGVFMQMTNTSYARIQTIRQNVGVNYNLALQPDGGRVGIGTNSPTELLTVGESTMDTGGATSMSILAPGENADSILYFGTARSMDRAKKAAIIAEGTSTYSRCNLHFCLDNTADNSTTYNASLSNSRMVINSSGNVGIGTTSPEHNLQITNGLPGNNYTLSDAITSIVADVEPSYGKYGMYFGVNQSNGSSWIQTGRSGTSTDASTGDQFNLILQPNAGNVGIGTTSPGATLEVFKAAYGKTNTTPSNPTCLIYGDHSDSTFWVGHQNQTQGIMMGYNTIKKWSTDGGATNDSLKFNVSGSTDMVIDKDGNVGIGTTTPDYKLDIESNNMRIHNPSTSQCTFRMSNTTCEWLIGVNNGGNGTGNSQLFFHDDSDYRLTIQRGTGNVGIGTTTPYAPLYVVGPEQVGNEPIQPYNTSSFNKSVIAGFTTTNPSSVGGNNFGIIFGALRATGAGYLQVQSTNTPTYYNLLLNPNGGKVGIGTTTPSYTLDVKGVGINTSVTSTYLVFPARTNAYSQYETTYSTWAGKFLCGAGPMGNSSGQNNWVATYACVFTTNGNLHLDSKTGSYTMYLNYYSGGNVHAGGAVRYTSDDRLKHNEKEVVNALDVINKLDVLTYFKSQKKYAEDHNYELDNSGNPITDDKWRIETGLIAQKVKEIPELEYCVSYTDTIYEDDDYGDYFVNYNDIFCYNIAATQELYKENQELKTEVATLKSELAAIKRYLGI